MNNKKGVKKKMEVREVLVKKYIETCPICDDKEIPGTDERSASYNLKIHMNAKHGKALPSRKKKQHGR